MARLRCLSVLALLLLVKLPGDAIAGRGHHGPAAHDYRDALAKSILFFEGQRSGKLPPSQRVSWRRDSGLSDGASAKVDLVGGYHDAGDNVKFGFPMAFSMTMLAWSVVEFGGLMKGELQHARDAVRWGADYLLKASAHPDTIYVQVGDATKDHACWERPEDMDTPRTVYKVDAGTPGSDVAAETAAALAAASLVFRKSDPAYAGRRPGCRLPRLPQVRPGLRRPPPRPRQARVRLRRPAPGLLQHGPRRRRVPLLLLLLRVPGRAPLGRRLAAPRHPQPRVPELHPGQRPGARRRRGRQHLRLGQQARRRARPHRQVLPRAARGVAARVQGPRRRVHLLHGSRHAHGPDAVHPGWAPVQAQRQQHAVRDLQRVPAAHLRQVPGVRQGDGELRRRRRDAAAAARRGEEAGGLPAGEQPDGDVVHGGVRRQVPAPDPPPGVVAAVGGGAPGEDRLLAGLHRALRRRRQPERARRRGGRRAGLAGQVPRPEERPRALGAGNVHQRAARRSARVPRALLRPALSPMS